MSLPFVLSVVLLLQVIIVAPLSAIEGASRPWTDQRGRTIQAKFIQSDGNSVVLETADGKMSVVPLANLSAADKAFADQQSKAAPSLTANQPLAWPPGVRVNPKDMAIVIGEQNATERKFHYQSGSFQFIANAALSPAVMRDVAADFELARALVAQLPWGWQPRPLKGNHFLIYLTETEEDFIALGGSDNSAAGTKDDYAFVKFTTLGLEKVGNKYAYDSRKKREGEVVGVTMRLLMGEMRYLAYPWALQGFEELLRTVAYHKDGFHFVDLQSELKSRIDEQAKIGVELDSERLLKYLRTPRGESRGDVVMIRRQNYFDGMLLNYFFGFLDGDGLGTNMHAYYRAVSQEALGWRKFKDSDGKSQRPRPINQESYPEWALDHLNKLLAGRTDAQLKSEIVTKFRAINVKFQK